MHILSKVAREAARDEGRRFGMLLESENLKAVSLFCREAVDSNESLFLRTCRAKYDAWKRLGDMPREKAMQAYVDELRKIVETMSYTENVADFYGSINQLDNVSVEDLQLVAPEAIKKARSNPNSPLHSRGPSRDASPSPTRTTNAISNGYVNGYQNGYGHSSGTSETSDDEYIDTVEVSRAR
jgi:hypothetical protein